MQQNGQIKQAYLAVFALCFSSFSWALKPKLALIIDDIGNQPIPLRLSTLPKEITLSIIPFSKYDSLTAYQAHSQGREIMLHLPMQSIKRNSQINALTLHMQKKDFNHKVLAAIERVPYAIAVNNHMGSELTQHNKPMSWLMTILKKQRLGFIDSRTTPDTVAQKQATKHGIANNRRHIFLDHEQKESFIIKQFNQAVNKAKNSQEAVIVIGHPHKITLQTLNKLLIKFENQIELVPISYTLEGESKITKNLDTK